MKEYDVQFTITITGFTTVQADDEIDAIEMVDCAVQNGIPVGSTVVITKHQGTITNATEVENE